MVADIRLDNWDGQLIGAGFATGVSTLVICEGFSMYFTADEFTRILRKVRTLCLHAGSRVWIDHVSSRFFDLSAFEVKACLSTMTRLGEPFVLGFDSLESIGSGEWKVMETTSASNVLGLTDVIHDEYLFSILA